MTENTPPAPDPQPQPQWQQPQGQQPQGQQPQWQQPPAGAAYPPPPGYAAPPPYPQQPSVPGYGQPPVSPSDARMWAMLSHLGGIFFSFIAPLVVYLIYKDRDAFVRDQSAEALNFQITLAIGYLVSIVLAFVLIGFLLMFVLAIGGLVLMILAAVAANRGERYRYPLTLRLVS